MTSTLLITGGRLIDPALGDRSDRTGDLWIVDGKFAVVPGSTPPSGLQADNVLDASGCLVCPGLIDAHAHLREPGAEEDETIATGAQSALSGGFTTVCCMPDTSPPIDTQATVEFIVLQARRARQAEVYPVGAVSRGREGRQLAELGQLARGGAVAFSDHDRPVVSAALMRQAIQYATMFDRPILQMPQEPELIAGGVMNEGFESVRLGLPGIPSAAEEIMVARDLRLLRDFPNARLHLQGISTAGAVDLIREAKAERLSVTAETYPHLLVLNDHAVRTLDNGTKVMPPLRTDADQRALIAGLADGTIDVLASGHAPLSPEKVAREIDLAPFGMVGLETALPLAVDALIAPGHLDWTQLVRAMSTAPACLFTLRKGGLEPGLEGDVTVIDPDVEWVIDPSQFHSKSRNSPFARRPARGRAIASIVSGEVRYLGDPARERLTP